MAENNKLYGTVATPEGTSYGLIPLSVQGAVVSINIMEARRPVTVYSRPRCWLALGCCW